MKDHKKWIVLSGHFKNIPITNEEKIILEELLDRGENVLVMINKEDPKTNPSHTPEEKHRHLFEKYRDYSIKGQLILSIVPDIENWVEIKEK